MPPVNIDIGQIKTLSELAPIFSVSEEQLSFFLNSKESLIRRGLIKKRDYTFREIVLVKDDSFKHFLQKLKILLYNKYKPHIPKSVHGFVKERSIITNAQEHTKKKVVLNVDIKSFFDSITQKKIEKIFLDLGFKKNIVKILSELVTVDGILATGFPTSPVISNMICTEMDKVFEEFSEKQKITYTRYADDVTFSSDSNPPHRRDIEMILEKFNFKANQNKYRIYRRGGPQYVTGLTVVDERPRLSRRLKRSMRLELYYINKYGFMNHYTRVLERALMTKEHPSKFSSHVFFGYGMNGFIAFIHSVEPKFAEKIWQILPKTNPLA